MSNEIGMMKGPGPVERSSPTASTERIDLVQQQVQEAKAKAAKEKERAEKAEQDTRAQEIAEEVASGLNELVHELHRELRFSVDEDSGETVIKVIDQQTEEVVRQIPSEEVVRLRKRLEEAAGVIFQDSA